MCICVHLWLTSTLVINDTTARRLRWRSSAAPPRVLPSKSCPAPCASAARSIRPAWPQASCQPYVYESIALESHSTHLSRPVQQIIQRLVHPTLPQALCLQVRSCAKHPRRHPLRSITGTRGRRQGTMALWTDHLFSTLWPAAYIVCESAAPPVSNESGLRFSVGQDRPHTRSPGFSLTLTPSSPGGGIRIGNNRPLLLSTTAVERVKGGYRFARHKVFVRMQSLWKAGEGTQREGISRSVGNAVSRSPWRRQGSAGAATESLGR